MTNAQNFYNGREIFINAFKSKICPLIDPGVYVYDLKEDISSENESSRDGDSENKSSKDREDYILKGDRSPTRALYINLMNWLHIWIKN